MKLRGRILIVIAVLFITTTISGIVFFTSADLSAEECFKNENIDMADLRDGMYKGHFNYFAGIVDVNVTFQIYEGELLSFNFENFTSTPGYNSEEVISERIDSLKNLNFDAVSGATISSDFAKAAIHNAVKNGAL